MKRTKTETRARILESAKELLSKKSAQFIQLRDIADRAGVSASLLVQYFGSKEELVFEARLSRLAAETLAEAVLAPDATLCEVFKGWFERDLAFAAATKDLMSLSWWWSGEDERRYAEALAPRLDAMAIALESQPERLSPTASRALTMIYAQALREACVGGANPIEAFENFRRVASAVVEI